MSNEVKKVWWSSGCGLIVFQMPLEAVGDCSHQGRCDDDVEHWQGELNLGLDRTKMINALREYGAWELEELKALDNDDLEQKLIWLAACDIKDGSN